MKLENSPDPPTSRLRPRPTSLVPKNNKSRRASTLEICLCSNNVCGELKPDRNSTADVFDSDERVVLQTARDASWQDPLTRLGLSVTPQSEQPEAPTALQDQQWRRMRIGTFHELSEGVERGRIVAHHCIHPSRVRSGLRMTRTAPVDPLSHSVGSRVKPFFCCVDDFYGQHCARSFCDWSRMCGTVCRFWFVCHFSVAGLSHEISARWEKCAAVNQSGCEHSRLEEAHFPNHCQCFDAKTVTTTLVSTPAISSFPGFSAVWTFNANSRMLQSTHHPENIGTATVAPAPSDDSDREQFPGRAVITSTATASASARGSPECDDCQETTDFFSCLSISIVSQKL